MTRYQALRKIRVDWLTAISISFMNWLMGYPENEIRFMHMVIEFDPEEKA